MFLANEPLEDISLETGSFGLIPLPPYTWETYYIVKEYFARNINVKKLSVLVISPVTIGHTVLFLKYLVFSFIVLFLPSPQS